MKTDLSQPELPPELRDYLESIPPVSTADLERLKAAARALDDDPAFQADYLKGLFVERMLEALAESGTTQNQLAQRWGKSRQYVSKLFHEDKRVNFTIETMSKLAHLLGRRLELQVLRSNEVAHVLRSVPAERVVVRPDTAWSRAAVPESEREALSSLEFECASGAQISTTSLPNDTGLAA